MRANTLKVKSTDALRRVLENTDLEYSEVNGVLEIQTATPMLTLATLQEIVNVEESE